MQVEFAIDATEVDKEIAMLESMRENVARGHLEVGRDDENRLVFRMSAKGRAYVENMGK